MNEEKFFSVVEKLKDSIFVRIDVEDVRFIIDYLDNLKKKYILLNKEDHYLLKLWNVAPDY